MKDPDAMQSGLQLLESADAAYLTTIDGDGFPQTRAMLNLRNSDQFPALSRLFSGLDERFVVYFTTNASSAKIEQIRRNPKVSVYYSIPAEWRGLMLGGVMEIVADSGLKKALWQKGWEMYYPGGDDDPDYAILRLSPMVAKYYHQLVSSVFDLGQKS